MKQKHFIDSHKMVTGLFVLVLMAAFGRWTSATLWVYLGLHGTYGLLWALKSRVFGDRQWEQRTGLGYGLAIWGALSLYWIAPFLIAWQDVQAPPWLLGLSVALNVAGTMLHFAADMQKHVALGLRPGVLIEDGLFARVRHVNYLGEGMIYLGFALLAMHWLPLLGLSAFILFFWVPNMGRIARSLSRYPAYAAYRARTKAFLPLLV
jgi:protein-S-isoprenylcysteine O-methyltransferase Ste14